MVVATVVGMVVVELVGRPEGRAEPGRERPARLLGRAPASIGSAANMFLANTNLVQLFVFFSRFLPLGLGFFTSHAPFSVIRLPSSPPVFAFGFALLPSAAVNSVQSAG